MNAPVADEAQLLRRAQMLRLKRFAWGWAAYAAVMPYVPMLHASGVIDGSLVVFCVVAWVVSALLFVAMILSGANLRLPDPSLTTPMVVAALFPSLPLAFACETPLARATVLFATIMGMLYGAFALRRRQLLTVAAGMLACYVAVLGALWVWKPHRLSSGLNEFAMLWGYSASAVICCLLGSFTAGLRLKLRERNAELQVAMGRLEELATIDPLTRLPNRRTLMERLEEERNRCERRSPQACALSVCILDIDHFKRFNDEHGHLVGDAVLRAVADGLQGSLRACDFIGRYGGEEFVLVLPESTGDGASLAADRIRQVVEHIVVAELPAGERVTASIGVALHRPGRTVEATLGAADAALYRAKRGGRNRVEMEAALEVCVTPLRSASTV